MRFSVCLRWNDWRVGAYWDGHRSHLYVCPLPTVSILIRFRRRVLCHKWNCEQPAAMICVHKADNWGEAFNRDALCTEHGKLGPCPDLGGQHDKHIPIVSRWYYEEPGEWQ